MKPDDFEKRLQQPLRQIPDDWRSEILAAAKAAEPSRDLPIPARPKAWWRELFWPHPVAWAGIAAIWIGIIAINVPREGSSQTFAKKPAETPPSRGLMIVIKEQRRELAALAGLNLPAEADKPKPFLPRPRSDRRDELMTA